MKKILFCDLDGTLLPRGKKSISKDVLAEIKRITAKGALFAVTSGRSYDELKALFSTLSQDVIFICLDGALAIYRDCVIYKNRLCKIEAGRLISLSPRATVFGRTKTLNFDENTNSVLRTQMLNTLGSEVFKVATLDSP
ncbi:MAG: HAD family phosphatase, partial [Clostridia bacterium]|nr:HAD family phosphatase [Clostridia bacterium]